MRRVQEIERQIGELSPGEYAELRDGFLREEARTWDEQFESDVKAGKLDQLGAAARRARAEGKSTLL